MSFKSYALSDPENASAEQDMDSYSFDKSRDSLLTTVALLLASTRALAASFPAAPPSMIAVLAPWSTVKPLLRMASSARLVVSSALFVRSFKLFRSCCCFCEGLWSADPLGNRPRWGLGKEGWYSHR